MSDVAAGLRERAASSRREAEWAREESWSCPPDLRDEVASLLDLLADAYEMLVFHVSDYDDGGARADVMDRIGKVSASS